MEFLLVYRFSLSYRRDKENANADFLSILPLPPIEEDMSDSCALSGPDDLGVYLIRACDFIPSFCPIIDITVGGLVTRRLLPQALILGGHP